MRHFEARSSLLASLMPWMTVPVRQQCEREAYSVVANLTFWLIMRPLM